MAEGGGLLNRYRGQKPYRGFESPVSPAPVHARPLPSSLPSIDRHLAAEASVAVRLGSWQAVVRKRRTSWPPRSSIALSAPPSRDVIRMHRAQAAPPGLARGRRLQDMREFPPPANPRRRRPVYFRHQSRTRNSTPCACCSLSVAASNLMLGCCAASAWNRLGDHANRLSKSPAERARTPTRDTLFWASNARVMSPGTRWHWDRRR